MKKGKRFLVIAPVTIAALLFTSLGTAQIEITWPDPPPTESITMKIDTSISVASLNLGTVGGPQTWNFNEVIDAWEVNFETKPVAGTPYEGAFPTAEWVTYLWQYLPPFLTNPAGIEDIYLYRRLENGIIQELGLGTDSALMSGSPFTYPTPSQAYPNPLTKDSPAWTELRFFQPTFLGIIQGSVTDSSIVTVDAWGDLTIPSGTYECLRLKRQEFRNIVVPGVYEDMTETYTYAWLTHSFDLVLSVSANASLGENFTTALYVMLAGSEVGVECDPECRTPGSIPTEFALKQNFPNPFNPTTNIQYTLPKSARVELRIFSILGQEVALLESSTRPPGEYSAVWNGRDSKGRLVPAGMYFYKLKAVPFDNSKTFLQTKKLIMMK
jgi:hypothetical protein